MLTYKESGTDTFSMNKWHMIFMIMQYRFQNVSLDSHTYINQILVKINASKARTYDNLTAQHHQHKDSRLHIYKAQILTIWLWSSHQSSISK